VQTGASGIKVVYIASGKVLIPRLANQNP
jgi:hypothetical protein